MWKMACKRYVPQAPSRRDTTRLSSDSDGGSASWLRVSYGDWDRDDVSLSEVQSRLLVGDTLPEAERRDLRRRRRSLQRESRAQQQERRFDTREQERAAAHAAALQADMSATPIAATKLVVVDVTDTIGQPRRAAAEAASVGRRGPRSVLKLAFWNQQQSLRVHPANLEHILRTSAMRRWDLTGVCQAYGWGGTGVKDACLPPDAGERRAPRRWRILWSEGANGVGAARVAVGLYIPFSLLPTLLSWRAVSGRILAARFKMARKRVMTLAVVYAPVSTDTAARATFFEELHSLVASVAEGDFLVIVGDFNARVGRASPSSASDDTCGPLGRWGEPNRVRNAAGVELIDFARENHMAIASTFFQHRRRQTWMGVGGSEAGAVNGGSGPVCNDYALVWRKLISSVVDVRVVAAPNLDVCLSDHHPIEVGVRLKLRLDEKSKVQRRPALDYASLADPNVQRDLAQAVERRLVGVHAQTAASLLAGVDLDSVATWGAVATELGVAAAEVLPPLPPPARKTSAADAMALRRLRAQQYHAEARRARAARESMDPQVKAHLNALRAEADRVEAGGRAQELNALCARLNAASLEPSQADFFKELRGVTGDGVRQQLKAVRGDSEGEILSSPKQVADAFASHFCVQLNPAGELNEDVLADLMQRARNATADIFTDPPSVEDVRKAVAGQKAGRAPDALGVRAELLQAAIRSSVFLDLLHMLLLEWWRLGLPVELKVATLVPIFKRKGDPLERTNYRPVALLQYPRKLVSWLCVTPLRERIDGLMHESQAGGRSGRGVADHLFTLRALMERSTSVRLDFCVAFLDLAKAFDSIPRTGLLLVLRTFGFAPETVRILEDLISDTQCRVKVGTTLSELFTAGGGVVQGASESLDIFNLYMLYCLLPVLDDLAERGVTVTFNLKDGEHLRLVSRQQLTTELVLYILLFVDDTAIVAGTPDELQAGLDLVHAQFTKFGLKLNAAKSELVRFNGARARPCARPGCPCPLQGSTSKRVICSRCDSSFHLRCARCSVVPPEGAVWMCPVCLRIPSHTHVPSVLHPQLSCGGAELRWVSEFKYLGVTFAADCGLDAEIDRRLRLANGAFATLSTLTRRGCRMLGLGSVSQIFNTLVYSVLLYGSESWAATPLQKQRLASWVRRKHAQLTRGRRHLDDEYHADVRVPDVATMLARRQLRYIGHVARSSGSRYILMLVSAQREGGRGTGSARTGLLGATGLYARLIKTHLTASAKQHHFPRLADEPRHRRWFDLAQRRRAWSSFVKSVHA